MIPDKYSRFLPFERYTLQTTLSEDEIIERLKIITRTTEAIQFSARKAVILRSNYDYQGEVSGKSFEIWRTISYRNSFRPIITGTITANANKTEIRICMNIHLVVRIFMIVVLSILGILLTTLALTSFSVLIPVIFLLALPLSIFLAFKIEARRSKKDLNTILKAETE